MSDCSKIPYANQWTALIALRKIQRKRELEGRKMPTGAYWCSPCRRWHLTSKSTTQKPPWLPKAAHS